MGDRIAVMSPTDGPGSQWYSGTNLPCPGDPVLWRDSIGTPPMNLIKGEIIAWAFRQGRFFGPRDCTPRAAPTLGVRRAGHVRVTPDSEGALPGRGSMNPATNRVTGMVDFVRVTDLAPVVRWTSHRCESPIVIASTWSSCHEHTKWVPSRFCRFTSARSELRSARHSMQTVVHPSRNASGSRTIALLQWRRAGALPPDSSLGSLSSSISIPSMRATSAMRCRLACRVKPSVAETRFDIRRAVRCG